MLQSKSLQIINAGEGVEKREPSYIVESQLLPWAEMRGDAATFGSRVLREAASVVTMLCGK